MFDGSVGKIPGKYRLPALASEAFQERVKQAMRTAGYEFDRIESDYGCLRFDGDMRMSFGSWREAARWLEEAGVRVESVWRKLPEGGFRRERP